MSIMNCCWVNWPRLARTLLALALDIGLAPAHAVLPDEIQVYTDDINKPREFGLELHVNTTPKGRTTPDFPGEITPYHGLRVTPEFSYGLARDWEAGLYMPYVRDAQGITHFAGPKLRLKWLPVQPAAEGQPWFMGANFEYAQVASNLEQSRYTFELRPIIGYRGSEWLIAVNPILGWALSGPDRDGKPEFSPSVKLARDAAPGIALGAEYYAGLGKINDFLPRAEQGHTLYFTIDYDRKPWVFNFGIGRGLTEATDRWTLKAIFELPFD